MVVFCLRDIKMVSQKYLKLLLLPVILGLSGCASVFFPDFDEGSDIVVDDGGKVEVRKVNNTGVLVADKDNALYEGEESSNNETDDKPMAVKVTEVEKTPVDEVKVTDNESQKDDVAAKPSMRYLAGVVYFADGGAEVDNAARVKLQKIAQTAKKNNAEVEVLGFASSRTRDVDPASHKLANFRVSAQRADKVAAILRGYGVKGENIGVQALSDSMPMYKEVMPEGERLNRRAEIYLTY